MMRALALVLSLCLPVAARADLTPTGAAILDLCQNPDLTLADRVLAAQALGLAPPTEAEVPVAALALAPYDMVFLRMFGLIGDPWDVARATERLLRSANGDTARQLRDGAAEMAEGREATLVGDAGIVLRLFASEESGSLCIVALPGLLPDDLATATGMTLEDRSRLPVLVHLGLSDDRLGPSYLGFTPLCL